MGTMACEVSHLGERIGNCAVRAIFQVCGGNFPNESDREYVLDATRASISFPNKSSSSSAGKPHDIEIRIALGLFHRWKQAAAGKLISLVSDLGLERSISSPKELARILCPVLEEACREDGIAYDVKYQPSGIICIVTPERSAILRSSGKLPCPFCIRWCNGEKGLWWHQQQNHKVEHSEAAAAAAASTNNYAIVLYEPFLVQNALAVSAPLIGSQSKQKDIGSPLGLVKDGDLVGLRAAIEKGYKPADEMDSNGASALMWAAGGGYLQLVRFLVEECGCDPAQPQRGKRSFCGRTALHWAARNGHLPVVKYLVNERAVDIEAGTIDGTTAFCWACWQGHESIMQFLADAGCDIHCTNSFGCNAALWCAQGKGEVSTIEWLGDRGCDLIRVNNNGHGVVHKAAQRGQRNICVWFFQRFVSSSRDISSLRLVSPDAEGYCPSDLAGMEGHDDLAKWLADNEMQSVSDLRRTPSSVCTEPQWPKWLCETHDSVSMRVSSAELNNWEKYGGVRRMRSKLT